MPFPWSFEIDELIGSAIECRACDMRLYNIYMQEQHVQYKQDTMTHGPVLIFCPGCHRVFLEGLEGIEKVSK